MSSQSQVFDFGNLPGNGFTSNAGEALAPLLFVDEELEQARLARDPVKKPTASASAKAKKSRKKTEDGLTLHSFNTLLAALAAQTKITWSGGRTGCYVCTAVKSHTTTAKSTGTARAVDRDSGIKKRPIRFATQHHF